MKMSRFTPCKPLSWLLEPITELAEIATKGAAILPSPARSSFEVFQNARKSGERLYSAVKSISWGKRCAGPNINGYSVNKLSQTMSDARKQNLFVSWFFEGKARDEQSTNLNLTIERTQQRQDNE